MSYLGSKEASGVFQAIIAQMPPHDTYIETHLGGGAIMRHKPPAIRNIAIDLDEAPLDSFKCNYGVEKVHGDAVDFLDDFDYKSAGRVLVYADPPYLHSTRTSRHRYQHEYTDQDHVALICMLGSIPANVIISGYPSPLYDRLLSNWRSMEMQAMTRGGVRTEKIWMNFEQKESHWHTFAGQNFTDRQRIKRKAQRWARNYAKLPPAERIAVMNALLDSRS